MPAGNFYEVYFVTIQIWRNDAGGVFVSSVVIIDIILYLYMSGKDWDIAIRQHKI